MFPISRENLFILAVASAVVLVFFAPVLMLIVGGKVAWPTAGLSAVFLGTASFFLCSESY